MRSGRKTLSSSLNSASLQLGNILLLASVTKTLTESGTRNLDPRSIPISETLVLQVLRKNSLDPSKKLDFFRWCFTLRPFYKHTACIYSHIFRTVCKFGFLDEVPDLLNSMKEDDVVVDSETLKLLLEAYIKSCKIDFALEILDYVEELGTGLNLKVYDSILVALVRKKQVGLALSILLKLLGACNDNSVVDTLPGCFACNELLISLRKSDMRLEFKQFFERLKEKKGFEFDIYGYNICIHAFGCWGDLVTSLRLFKEMKEKGLVPDLYTYNSLIQVLCMVGKVKDALMVWEELKVSGHEPNEFTYRNIIQGCCKSYLMDDAMRIFGEMHYNGFIPDTVVYNSLLNGMFKARKVMEACQLFEKMVQDGVRTSCWTHNILIDGLFRNGRAVAAYTLFCDLKKKRKFVDAITFSIVVLQLCREGHLEEALQLVEEMEGRGFVVDLVTITSLLIAFHKYGRWDCTKRLMKHIRDGNLVLDVLKWKADVEAAMRSRKSKRKDYTPMFPSKGDLSEIRSLIGSTDSETDTKLGSEDVCAKDEESPLTDINEWSSSPYMDKLANQVKSDCHSSQLFSLAWGQRVQGKEMGTFDIDMVNTFLSIFLANGKLNLACKLFEIFTDMGVDPVIYTYNSMMSSFVKKGYFSQAWGVLNEMGEKICPKDIATYNVIIQGLGKMGRADLVGAILDKLMKLGGYLDVVMYNTLINVLGKAGRFDEAYNLFEQMRTSGINPDVVTFNTLIEVHGKAGRLKEAHKFLKMMLDSGCLPNHVTDTTLDFLGREIDKLGYRKESVMCNKDDFS